MHVDFHHIVDQKCTLQGHRDRECDPTGYRGHCDIPRREWTRATTPNNQASHCLPYATPRFLGAVAKLTLKATQFRTWTLDYPKDAPVNKALPKETAASFDPLIMPPSNYPDVGHYLKGHTEMPPIAPRIPLMKTIPTFVVKALQTILILIVFTAIGPFI
jgi:hypothetical protein